MLLSCRFSAYLPEERTFCAKKKDAYVTRNEGNWTDKVNDC
jgi:hypothetical protein